MLLLCSPVQATVHEDPPQSPVSYTRPKVAGVWAHVVTVDLNAPGVEIRALVPPSARKERFGRLVGREQPVAAINGTFFDPPSGTVLGSIVQDGNLIREGWLGSAIRIDQNGQGSLLPMKRTSGRHFDWSDTNFAISSGPTLVEHGALALNPRAEGFRDPAVYRPARRSALGLTKGNKLVLVSVTKPVSLKRLAMMMQALGCRHAVNLDGGTSSALYYRGKHIVKAGRALTNAVGVFVNPAAAEVSSRRALQHYQKGFAFLGTRPARARAHLLRAVALAPRQARYWSALATAHERLGFRADAVDALVRASNLYREAWKPEAARRLARRAVSLNGARPDAWLALAQCAPSRGARREALQRVLTLRPGHRTASEMLESL